jgi:hypothetical protein
MYDLNRHKLIRNAGMTDAKDEQTNADYCGYHSGMYPMFWERNRTPDRTVESSIGVNDKPSIAHNTVWASRNTSRSVGPSHDLQGHTHSRGKSACHTVPQTLSVYNSLPSNNIPQW